MAPSGGFCGRCGKEPNTRLNCDGCENMQYCSAECQQADSDSHSILCEQFQDYEIRPEEEGRRAIFSPADGDKPRFTWVPDDVGSRSDNVLVAAESHGRQVKHSIGVRLDMNHLNDVYPLQGCLRNMIGAEIASHLRGPITFYGTGKAGNSKCVYDLDTRDLTLAIKGLTELWRKTREAPRLPYKPRVPVKVNAVKFTPRTRQFEDVQIPVQHPIFTSGDISKISEKFGPGLPTLKMYQEPDPDFPTQRLEVELRSMPLAAYLDMDISKKPGCLFNRWMDETSIVLIARADCRVLSSRTRSPSELIQQACWFIQSCVRPKILRNAAAEVEPNGSAPREWEESVKTWYAS